MKKWKLLKSEPVFQSKWMTVRDNTYELPSGERAENYYHLERPDFVVIVAVNPNKELLVIRQYRRGVDDFVYEFPAGFINPGETPEEAAHRELKEETGFSGKLQSNIIDFYYTPSFAPIKGYVVTMTLDYLNRSKQDLDSDEEIEFEFYPVSKVKEMILQGKLKDMSLITALTIYLLQTGNT